MHVQPTTLWFRFSFDFFFIVVVVVAAVIVLFHVFRFCCYLFQTEYIFFSGSLGQRHASCLQIFIWPHSNYDAPVPYFARIFFPICFLHSFPSTLLFHSHGLFKWPNRLRFALNNIFAFSQNIFGGYFGCLCVCVETVFVVGNSHLKIYWTIVVAVDRAFSTTTTTAREKFAHNNNNRHWHLKISAKGWETSSNFEFSAL